MALMKLVEGSYQEEKTPSSRRRGEGVKMKGSPTPESSSRLSAVERVRGGTLPECQVTLAGQSK